MREDLKKRWDALVEKVVDRREDFDKFVSELEKRSTYFTAPASPGYHCNWEEGLLEHSINVAEAAVAIKNVLAPGYSDESCVICGLFHDLGKGPLDRPYYLFNEPTANQKKYGFVVARPFKYNEDPQIFMTVPQTSVRQITQYIDLTDWEYQAILIHDGVYVDENKAYGTKETPFALILHYADSWSGFILEGSMKPSEDGKRYEKKYNTPRELLVKVKGRLGE